MAKNKPLRVQKSYAATKAWRIPKKGQDGEWYPLIRLGRTIPFGYAQDEEDPDLLLPIPEELELLDQAKAYLREYSSRVVAKWLSEKSGRYISHAGLLKRVSIEESRRGASSQLREYQRRTKKAAEKAEKLENRIGGTATRKYYRNKDGSRNPETSED
jgi:hypothetical protein